MTPTDLIKRARELAEKATPGPWDNRCREFSNSERPRHVWAEYGWIASIYSPLDSSVPDAEFIAESRTLVPALADALEKALEEKEQK